MKKICVISGSRAEYGLLRPLMKAIQGSSKLKLQLIVTGMHLSPEFGLTYKKIEKNNFHIDKKIEMVVSADTPSAIAKSTGLGIIGFADAISELQPDMLLLLGDRYEILAASLSGMVARIPIAHIHGGETTQGAFDESIRHAITKMSWWHFVATEQYAKRVVQLGEDPSRVFNVGGLGVDLIKQLKLLSKRQLSDQTNINFRKKNIVVTFHPVTLENYTSGKHFQALLDALLDFPDINVIFTKPNADTDGRVIIEMIDNFTSVHSERSISFTSMGNLRYLSTLQFVDGVIGNSSSGLIEAPFFKIGTVNIGDRQKGRMMAKSIINCKPSYEEIKKSIIKLYSNEFSKSIKDVENPYGQGGATKKILNVLEGGKFPKSIKKHFFDI